eukprot:gene15958-18972_t
MALAMMNYMVELETVDLEGADEDAILSNEFEANGHDLKSLLFSFMDEVLFLFSTEFTVFKSIKITSFDRSTNSIKAIAKGIELDKSKHTTGTEIKAITYSCMRIEETPEKTDIYTIVDI